MISATDLILWQDNEQRCTSNKVRNWMEDTYELAPQCTDFNPIENIWQHIKMELFKYERHPKGVFEIWGSVGKYTVRGVSRID